MALLERTHMDEVEAEWLWTELDDLLKTIEGFRMEHDLAR